MNKLSEVVSKYSDEDLEKAFKEIEEYKRTAILPLESISRKINRKYNEQEGFPIYWDEDCRVTCEAILFELSRRYVARLNTL